MRFEILEHVADLGKPCGDWRMELNVVAWNGRKPRLDIRVWSEDHTHMTRGISMSDAQAERLAEAILNRREKRNGK